MWEDGLGEARVGCCNGEKGSASMRPSCVWVRPVMMMLRMLIGICQLRKPGVSHVNSHRNRRGFVPNLVKAVKVHVRSPSSSGFAFKEFSRWKKLTVQRTELI